MRILFINVNTVLPALLGTLLTARLSAGKAASALASLQALNPHVSLDAGTELPRGTVLLVPDTPSFRASASSSVAGDALDGFQQLVSNALESAASRLKDTNTARKAERADVVAVLKIPAVKRMIDGDPQIKKQLDEAASAFKEDQQQAAQAEQFLGEAGKAALAELAIVAKLLS